MTKTPKTFNKHSSNNPLIIPSTLPHGAPAFDKVKTEHFEPALDWGMKQLIA